MVGFIFGGNTGETAESLAQKRKVAEALLARRDPSPDTIGGGIASVMQAIAGRVRLAQLAKQEAKGRSNFAASFQDALSRNGGFAPGEISGTGGVDTLVGSSGGSGAKPFKVNDPVADDLAPHQRAFLNAVSGGESNGAYNVRYTPNGPAFFDDLSRHPGIMEPGPHGKTSASGRYQFTKTTWDGMGGGDFSPANQDHRAWQLAQRDYGARTGRDLDADLQANGLTPQIMEALTPTWQAFKGNQGRHAATYRDSLGRFSGNNSMPGGEAEDTLGGGGGVIVGDGGPSIPMADGTFRHGIQPRGVNPLPPDRLMPDSSMQPEPATARFNGPAAPKGDRLPDPNAMPAYNPMMASAPMSPGMPSTIGQAPAPQKRMSPMISTAPSSPDLDRKADPMKTSAAFVQPAMQRPSGIVSVRGEDAGYRYGPGGQYTQAGMQPQANPRQNVVQAVLARGGGQPAPQQPPQQAAPGPSSGPAGMVDQASLIQLMNDPYATPGAQAVVQAMLERQMQASDPGYQLDQETKRLQVEKLRADIAKAGKGDGSEFKVVGNDLVRIGPDGTTNFVTPEGGNQSNTEFRFSGNSVEAQALNGLMDSGKITPEQAQNIAAGKTVTGPNGEVYFFNAGQLVTQPPPAGANAAGPAPTPTAGPTQLTKGKTALPPEAAARVGMGNGFLERYQAIEDDVKAGGLTGPWDQGMASIGRGRQGDLMRQIQSGQDGLLRMLTGAGMPDTEAQRYIKRYQPGWMDDAESATLKLQGLKYDLDHVDEAIKKGREEGLGGAGGGGPKIKRYNPKTGKLEEVAQ